MFTGNAICASFKAELLTGVHDFSEGGHVFKLALYDETASMTPLLTAYSSSGEVEADGDYTAGGVTLTHAAPSISGLVALIDFADLSISAEISARGGLIYNSTATGNPAVLVLDFGVTRSSVDGVFRVRFPEPTAETAIIRIG